MTRPTVLIATTNPVMALALKASLGNECKNRGLKLEVCPGGNRSDVDGKESCAYESADALFEELASRDSLALCDTLVILDVGVQLLDAFEPKAPRGNGWHTVPNRAGVAVELLLRFPHVFPVFLSPAVPLLPKNGPELNGWKAYSKLQTDFQELEKYARATRIHFASPLDGEVAFKSVLTRFSNGMRSWFDPTGLRTLVKDRFLGVLFGSNSDQINSIAARTALRRRLDNVAVAIDEEREFAVLNAYAAYKFGRRAWIVTTHGEFCKLPDLPCSINEMGRNTAAEKDIGVLREFDVVVLRDLDLRFPDVPDEPTDIREQLSSICSKAWETVTDRPKWRFRVVSSRSGIVSEKYADSRWANRPSRKTASSPVGAGDTPIAPEETIRLGERMTGDAERYVGLKKPIGTLYELKVLLGIGQSPTPSVVSQLELPSNRTDKSESNHGAPYLNLAMAESLLLQASDCSGTPTRNILGALLAGEAYELLLCMSKTTALEALLLQQKKEVEAEVAFPGISHTIDIALRRYDVEATLQRINQNEPSFAVTNIYLCQFWSELRTVYKNAEQFRASDQASTESLVHTDWMPILSRWLSYLNLHSVYENAQRFRASRKGSTESLLHSGLVPFLSLWLWLCLSRLNSLSVCAKRWVVKPAMSFWWWLGFGFAVSVVLTAFYWVIFDPTGSCREGVSKIASPDGIEKALQLWHEVVLMSFNSNPAKGILNIEDCLSGVLTEKQLAAPLVYLGMDITDLSMPSFGLYILTLMHFSFSYVMLGLLISMIFRKITRA